MYAYKRLQFNKWSIFIAHFGEKQLVRKLESLPEVEVPLSLQQTHCACPHLCYATECLLARSGDSVSAVLEMSWRCDLVWTRAATEH